MVINEKKVSVIIPIYNAEKYIETTLKCLLKQKYKNFEVILVNDASTDNTLNIIYKYKDSFEKIGVSYKVVNREQNGGLCAAINSGLNNASGDYLCFPDSDDELMVDYISGMMSILEKDTTKNWVRCNYAIVLDDEDREYDVELPKESVYKNDFYDFISKYIAHNAWNMIVSKKYFNDCIGEQILDSRLTQEWSLLLPLSYHEDYARCEKKLYKYHIRKNAMSSWQKQDINSVIEHINGLEELNYSVLNCIKPFEKEMIPKSNTALKIYYHLFRYKIYCNHNLLKEKEMEKKEILCIAQSILKVDVTQKIKDMDIVVRLVFDKLLEGKTKEALKQYCEYKKLVTSGYLIVFDYGGKSLIDTIVNVYGAPIEIVEEDKFDVNNLKNTVICLIQNSKTYSQMVSKYKGDIAFLEYRNVRNSIRGWYVNECESME